jgi:hypothetical protein
MFLLVVVVVVVVVVTSRQGLALPTIIKVLWRQG